MKGGCLPSKEKPSFPAFNQAPTSESAIASDDEVGTTWDNEKLATVKSRAFKGHKKGVTAVNYLCVSPWSPFKIELRNPVSFIFLSE
jgi:hypothetical protein